MKNDRVVEILKRANEERCNSISEEMSCGDSIEQCKRCTMKALEITEEEYNELFTEYPLNNDSNNELEEIIWIMK